MNRWYWVLSGGLAVLIFSTLLTCTTAKDNPRPQSWGVLAGWRPVACRLDSDSAHVPWQPEQARGERQVRRAALAAEETRLSIAQPSRQGSSELEMLILLDLVWGKTEGALSKLEGAPDEFRQSPFHYHARAVALILRAEKTGYRVDLVHALAATDRAIELDPGHLAAMFNRALILERLCLPRSAQEAWRYYAQFDPTSGWGGEAADRAQKLESLAREQEAWSTKLTQALESGSKAHLREIVGSQNQALREFSEQYLLGGWAEAQLRGDAQTAAGLLERARLAASVLAGPDLVSSCLERIQQMGQKPRPSLDLNQLASALLALRDGVLALKGFHLGDAEVSLNKALQILRQLDVPAALHARYHLAVCRFQRADRIGARTDLDGIERELPADSFPSLRGRLFWMRGLIDLLDGRPIEAIEKLDMAGAEFSKLGEIGYLSGIETLLGSAWRQLGLPEKGLEHYLAAIEMGTTANDGRRLYVTNVQITELLREMRLTAITLPFQQEARLLAQGFGDPQTLVRTRLLGAEIWLDLGESSKSLKDIQAARALLPEHGDSTWGALSAQIGLAEGKARTATDPAQAIEIFDQVRANLEQIDWHTRELELLRSRAEAHLVLGNRRQAESDLQEGILMVESLRTRIEDPIGQRSFLNQSRKLFDAMIGLQLDQGRTESAWEYAERFRAQAHLGRLPSPDSGHASLNRPIWAELPSNLRVIEYAVVDERVVFWLIGRGGVTFFQCEQPATWFQSQLAALLAAVMLRQPVQAMAAALHGALIQPALGLIEKGQTLVIVPDGSLHSLPFPLLFDASTERFLIEDFPLIIAPSMQFYQAATSRYRERETQDFSALIVGNPTFDPKLFPHLRTLPGAHAEALSIAELYPRHLLLLGGEASEARFREEAYKHAVIHFGGHGVEAGPDYSHLVLAPSSAGDSGLLYTFQAQSIHWDRTRLLILAACGPADPSATMNEGPQNLVRAFLTGRDDQPASAQATGVRATGVRATGVRATGVRATGVPAVLASLWYVDDHAAADLFLNFHRALQSGNDPVTGLRSVQLRACRQLDLPPLLWAGFQIHGGVPPP